MCGQIKRFISVFLIVWLINGELNSQPYITRNNFTGNWEDPEAWDLSWPDPDSSISGTNVYINGFITIHSSLAITGTASTLRINDTLVVLGNLRLGNNNNLVVDDGGVLIVRGNLVVVNNTDLFTQGYVIVTGDFINISEIYDGSFWTTNDPSNVFFGGSVPLIDHFFYPVLNCTDPILTPYPNSDCGYGNMTDLMNEPVYEFFQTTCTASIQTGSNSPLCEGDTLVLTAAGGTDYTWSGPGDFTSSMQNPVMPNVSASYAGEFIVSIMSLGCSRKDTVVVVINVAPEIHASADSPLCEGDTLFLSAEGGLAYAWSGPGGFTSSMQNPVIPDISASYAGEFIVSSISAGCSRKDTVVVVINVAPEIHASATSPLCEGEDIILTAEGGNSYEWKGPEDFTSYEQNPVISDITVTRTGIYSIRITSEHGCADSADILVTVNSYPIADAGPDQVLENYYETNLKAALSGTETGKWSLLTGSGNIRDAESPVTLITGLAAGENVFRWKVLNGNCEAGDDVSIIVNQLFVPSVITPNNDGKNDYFKISAGGNGIELIIFNRWGIIEFSSTDYINNWNGLDKNNAELPDDTYFYVVRLKNGEIRKGSILIKRK